jgi:CBS-domain-containing membrane protein
MANFAIVINNSVTNIIVADDEATALAVSPQGATAVECQSSDLVAQGWTYDGTKLIAPVIPEVVVTNA